MKCPFRISASFQVSYENKIYTSWYSHTHTQVARQLTNWVYLVSLSSDHFSGESKPEHSMRVRLLSSQLTWLRHGLEGRCLRQLASSWSVPRLGISVTFQYTANQAHETVPTPVTKTLPRLCHYFTNLERATCTNWTALHTHTSEGGSKVRLK